MGRSEPSSFGKLLRVNRLAAELTQAELAERAGLSRRGVQDLEHGVTRTPHRETARRLADALGLEGGDHAVLVQAGQRAKSSSETPTSAHTRRALPHVESSPNNLPAEGSSFVGRQRQLSELISLLASSRLLTLTGAGGVGKTRLALQMARQVTPDYQDGVWLVELASLNDPTLVPQFVASVIGVPEQPGRPLLTTLTNALRPRRLASTPACIRARVAAPRPSPTCLDAGIRRTASRLGGTWHACWAPRRPYVVDTTR
jgi:transcriptional regulator with XRE-family HTH domain